MPRCSRSSWRRRRSFIRRPARSSAAGAAVRRHAMSRSSCAERCIRSRAARGWPARCAWASSTHLMESRLVDGEALVAATPELFDALDDRSRPHRVRARRACATDARTSCYRGLASMRAAAQRAEPAAERLGDARRGRPAIVPLPRARRPRMSHGRVAGRHARRKPRPRRARCCACAPTSIDRLVNEAGEVAIARARIEGELRALKANLLELTEQRDPRCARRCARSRSQAESADPVAHVGAAEQGTSFDPLEFDRFTRFQELTRSLAEGVNDVSTVQQALLKNLDDADAALLAQARLSREVQQRLFAIRTVPFGSLSERLYRIVRADGARSSTSAPTSRSAARRSSSTARCWKSSSGRSSTCCATRSTTASRRARARVAAGKPETGEIALDGAPGRQRSRDRARRRRRAASTSTRIRAKARRARAASPPTRAAPTRSSIECIFQPGLLDGVEGHADLRARHRHGRRAREIAALGGRVEIVDARGQRHDIHPVPAAHARGRAGGAGARRRPAVGAARADGRAGAAGQGARRSLDLYVAAQGRVAGPATIRSTICRGCSATPQHNPGDAALQLGAAAAQRPAARGDARRRDDRQPGSRGEEHRAAARARVRHRRRDGARQRRDRADHQPGAARAARRRAGVRRRGERPARHRRRPRGCAAAGATARRSSWSSTTRSRCARSPSRLLDARRLRGGHRQGRRRRAAAARTSRRPT